MAEQDRVGAPGLAGGVSTQPPHQRYANQVEEGINVVFSAADGVSKRPGSRFLGVVPGLTGSENIAEHPIHRDANEQYVLLAGDGHAIVMPVLDAPPIAPVRVIKDSRAAAYLAGAAGTALRFGSVGDYTLIGNTGRTMQAVRSDPYVTAEEHRTFERVMSRTPAPRTVMRARDESPLAAPGHWRYQPKRVTYPTLKTTGTLGVWCVVATWNRVESNPIGFRLFCTVAPAAGINATYDASLGTITAAGAFTDFVFQDNTYLNVLSGTGFSAQPYKIGAKVSNNTVQLVGTLPGGNATDVSFSHVGVIYDVRVDLRSGSVALDMDDVAARLQDGLRAAGARHALVSWTSTNIAAGNGQNGYFTITSPFGGRCAGFPASNAMLAPTDATLFNIAAILNPCSVLTQGTGADTLVTTSPEDRWVRVAPPDQDAAELDPLAMPQALVRVHAGGNWTWGKMADSLEPWARFRLGEASGNVCFDETGRYNGTIQLSAVRVSPGSLTGSEDDGGQDLTANNRHLTLGGLGQFATQLKRPFTIECAVKSNVSTRGALVAMGTTSDGSTQSLHVWMNTSNGTSDSQGRWWFRLSDTTGKKLTGAISTNTGVSNNAWKTIAVKFDAASNTINLWIDGAPHAVTISDAQTPDAFAAVKSDTTFSACGWDADGNGIAASSSRLAAHLDELSFYTIGFDDALATLRHQLRTNATVNVSRTFLLRPTEWAPRVGGDPASNPPPKPIEDGKPISDICFFRDRLVMLSGEWVITSGDGDYFQLYLENPANITPADPISMPAAGDQVSTLDFGVQLRDVLTLFSIAGQQFEFTGDGALTPDTATITAVTKHRHIAGVRPVSLGDRLFDPSVNGKHGTLLEYSFAGAEVFLSAINVGAHVERYIPASLKAAVACPGAETVLVMPSAGDALYVYRFMYQGGQKVQSAWAKWTRAAGETLMAVASIDDTAYLLSARGGQVCLESITLGSMSAEPGMPCPILLDRGVSVSGVHAAGNTTFTLPGGLDDDSILQAVDPDGVWHIGTNPTGTALVIADPDNDLGGVTCMVGRHYPKRVRLTRPFALDFRGRAIPDRYVTVREVQISHVNTGAYVLRGVSPNRADQVREMTAPTGAVLDLSDEITHSLAGEAETLEIWLENDTPFPSTIASAIALIDKTQRP